ncbi:MAG: hypothetical protein U9O87_02170 [Verrucomicrobiota bacterium]|nr:hypothetical protein [Verrucomicrobiota bacterium]
MTFEFDGYTIATEQINLQLNETYFAPTKIKLGRPGEFVKKHKSKEVTQFAGLYYKRNIVTENLFYFIDLIEILKAYSNKKLELRKEYKFENFNAKIVSSQKDKTEHLRINFYRGDQRVYYHKFDCMRLSAKMNKVLSKCELVVENG